MRSAFKICHVQLVLIPAVPCFPVVHMAHMMPAYTLMCMPSVHAVPPVRSLLIHTSLVPAGHCDNFAVLCFYLFDYICLAADTCECEQGNKQHEYDLDFHKLLVLLKLKIKIDNHLPTVNQMQCQT